LELEAPIEIGRSGLSKTSIYVKIPQIPEIRYRLYAQIDEMVPTQKYADAFTTVFVSTTAVIPAPDVPLSKEEVVNNILGAICSQFTFDNSYSYVLQNLIVKKDSTDEDLIISHVKDADGSVILKLYEPLTSDKAVKDEFYIVNERVDPYIVTVTMRPDGDPDPSGSITPPRRSVSDGSLRLRGPNWSIDDPTDIGMPFSYVNLIDVGKSNDTGFLRYNDIVGYNLNSGSTVVGTYDIGDEYGYVNSGSVYTDILNEVINSSQTVSDKDLNIDFSDYSNFVFYSSAKERLTNFRYKLRLIESYDEKIGTINAGGSITGSAPVLSELYSEIFKSVRLFMHLF
jgi:hypothetical protein